MNVADLRDYAKTVARRQKISIQGVGTLERKSTNLRAGFTNALQNVVNGEEIPLDPFIDELSALETETAVALQQARATIARANVSLDNVKTSTETAQNADMLELDLTSKQLLADYVAEYEAAYYTLVLKVIMMIVLLYLMRGELKYVIGTYIVLFIVLYIGLRFYTALTMRQTGQVL
jgi:hypothetical protein